MRTLTVELTTRFCFAVMMAGAAGLATAKEPASQLATTPEVQTAEWAVKWWMPRHEEKLAEKSSMERVDLLWVGDSITHSWETTGKKIWDEKYAKRNALNLGFSGDRTEQVLWRLQNGEVEGLSPKLIVMMIGTNNTGHRQDPAEATAAGVAAIIQELKTRMPDAKLLLLGIFPRGATADDPLRVLNAEINGKLEKMADGNKVHYLDIGDVFLDDDGGLPESIMPDRLHPNAAGYQLWADAIEPSIQSLLDE